MWALRAVMLLALVVWVGGIIFFAFVMAPTLFVELPSPQMAGSVVGPALTKLHWMGLIAGGLFLISSTLHNWRQYAQLRLFSAAHLFVVLMLALTALSQFAITPRMRELRSAPQGLGASDNRAEFNRLHDWSTRAEGAVLFLGLGVVVLTARRMSH